MFSSTDCIVESIPPETELQEVQEKDETPRKNKEGVKETVVHLNSRNSITPGTANVPAKTEVEEEPGENGRKFIEVFIAETVGTALLLCMGCMGGIKGFSPDGVHPAQSAACFGMVVASIIQIFGHISAAHLNPCVSVCFYVLGEISLPMLANYFVAETLGAIIGFGLLKALTPGAILDEQPILCCTTIQEQVSTFQALSIEFVSTGLLVMLVCACTDPVNSSKQDSAPIKFGIFVTVISILAGPYTGASINPTRTLAPAMWNGYWTNQWVYWAGPLSASVVVPILYQTLFWKGEKPRRMRNISKKFVVTKIK